MAPKGYRVYLDRSTGAKSDGFRFVLDMTKGNARKWHRLYCPSRLKMYRVPAREYMVRGRIVKPLLERPSTTELEYDPASLARITRNIAKQSGRKFSKADLQEVLTCLT